MRALALVLIAAVLTGCSGGAAPDAGPTRAGLPSASASTAPSSAEPAPVNPVSVPGLAEEQHTGDRLRLGRVRERTAAYTSYDVSYRSTTDGRSLRISGVLNVPRGKGPFPAVVLAHGYIDPAVYRQGQGMTRERGSLAERGYLALHVDYRNHAASDRDRRPEALWRLGYSADVINAVKALRASELPVVRDRIFFFGRSMGGGVVLKALIAEPGLVRGAALWASVSSLEADNYRYFIAREPTRAAQYRPEETPDGNPVFWRENSARPYVDRITEPVLLVHGRRDETCPPAWARATRRALTDAGVDTQLGWYDDGHAFGPAFGAAMQRTVRYFDGL